MFTTKNDSKNISKKNKCIRNRPTNCNPYKILVWALFWWRTLFTFWNIVLYLSNPWIVTSYCQKVSLSQPKFIEHNFLFKDLTLWSKMAEYNFQTFKQMNLWYSSHSISHSISSKWINAVHESQNLPLYFKQTNV